MNEVALPRDGDQQGRFAARTVRQAPEHHRAERSHDEADSEGRERKQK